MEKFGVRLLTVECAYENSPFTLTQPNYEPYNIQVRTDSAFFQKESMINLAVSKLPQDAKYVSWVDYEVEFTNPNWLNDSIKALNMFKIAQLFDEVSFVNNNGEELKREKGFASQLGNKKNLEKKNYEIAAAVSGFGWGIRKDALKELNGLIDFTLIGNNEKVMAYCLGGKMEDYVPEGIAENFRDAIKNWQKKATTIFTQGVGFIPGIIKVNNSLAKRDRKFIERWEILAENGFDPRNDLQKDAAGLYVLSASKPKLNEELRILFDTANDESLEA